MRRAIRDHLRHHLRFYLAAALGAIAGAATGGLAPPTRLALAADFFFAAYLAAIAVHTAGATPETMRRRAAIDDEGMPLIVLITLGAIASSIAAIFAIVGRKAAAETSELVLALASVLLGWLTLHTIVAMRYAHLYYARAAGGGVGRDAGGLVFPGTEEPVIWDFLYFSFVVGMTAQVSDVQVASPRLRRLTLAHGVASFFFNTIILALAVNVAAGLVG